SSECRRSMLTRADTPSAVDEALATARSVIDRKGVFSKAARDAQFYIGELFMMKKDYSAAAREFKQFIKLYAGPKQDANGDFVEAERPWKPTASADEADQVYEASVRIAHAWFLQGHTQNMLKAYEWIAKNLDDRNPHMTEAQYWLAADRLKAAKPDDRDARKAAAEAMWKNVVNSSLDFADPKFNSHYRPWARASARGQNDAEQYVKAAAMKAGQAFSEAGQHDLAAGVFERYLDLFGTRGGGAGRGALKFAPADPDEAYSIARYALGREYAALGNVPGLVECYMVYVRGMRDDRFRVSALMTLGYYAAQAGRIDDASEAYATLLDEYGPSTYDSKGNPKPVPRKEWIRSNAPNWNGIRQPVPKGLDLAEVRYALGFVYWKQNDYSRCAQTLAPLMADANLAKSNAAATALYMLGRSHFKLYDFKNAAAVIDRLVGDFPKFEAIEEAYVYAARAYCETGDWTALAGLCKRFNNERRGADRQPYIDLYAAAAQIGAGQVDEGIAKLKGLADANTFEDVKAEAMYRQAAQLLTGKTPDYSAALKLLEKSIATSAREPSCVSAAKCCIALKKWPQAKELLDRTIRDFPGGDARYVQEAKTLLPEVLKQLAAKKE
ncbi:MAG: tetratricopeptide repeat protein, partial [Phycisphaerae bacterium]|nr:tetratricopeptide repeat protein [Phycisphaerae bacterium]